MNVPDMILYNGKITTLDPSQPEVSAIAITDGLITAVGGDELLNSATEKTKKNRP
ncbi:putative amidohydrolase 3 [Bacillus anthracis]|nr:putative amidohydrolase 3 [Bacillus anthracis]KFL68298.1 putative amidohydrolase 3 [Bacillus anthracis]